jgi:D-aminopeptidase
MARMTIRDLGYAPGTLPTGPKNSILDVKGELRTQTQAVLQN